MKLGQLKPAEGATHSKKRVGRGHGSGLGRNAGRGDKGYHSRSGSKHRPWFEGGQMPLVRRIPKRGPKRARHKKVEYDVVNVKTLNLFDDGENITVERLISANLVPARNPMVKILGTGTLEKQLTVQAHGFSKSAIEQIESKGGTVEVI